MRLDGSYERDGCVLRFADSGGRGPAVILSHGAGADHVTFERQFDALVAAGHRAVLWDLRGHGLSRPSTGAITSDAYLDDLFGLIDFLRLDRPALAGHSLGGNLSQEAVRRRPNAFRALAVLDSTWNAGPLSRFESVALAAAAPSLALVPARTLPRLMARVSAVTASARADALRAFSMLSKAEFIAIWRATVGFVRPDSGYTTPIPLLLVVGAEDGTGNIASAMRRWAEEEGVPLSVARDAGHFVTLDAPEVVDDLLLEFFGRVLR